jgi:hypothetical protein
MERMSKVQNNATGQAITFGVRVVSEDKFAHLRAIVQKDEGKRYIMRGYIDDMKGTKIPDNMVVKQMNRRYFRQQDGEDWAMKSTDRCPTYGICKACASSRPAGMHCQLCREKEQYYKCPWIGDMFGARKWIDAEWILMCEMTHLEAGADRIQTYPFPTTLIEQITQKWLFAEWHA